MDEPEIDTFLSICKQLVFGLFTDHRHGVRISFVIALAEGISSEDCLACFCKHFSGCETFREVENIMYKTSIFIGELKLSTIYAVAKGAEKARAMSSVSSSLPSSSTLLSAFLKVCLSVTGDTSTHVAGDRRSIAWILREMLGIEHPPPTTEETPMQRLAAKMSSTITGVEKDLVKALRGDEGNLPPGMEYSRSYIKKSEEITGGIASIKKQLDNIAFNSNDDSDN